jgi:hypothetical protein
VRLVSERTLEEALRERFPFEGGPHEGIRPGRADAGHFHPGDNGD